MPPRRDSRFKVQAHIDKSEVEQFKSLEMGGLWEDANLLQCLLYAWTSKHLRLGFDGVASRMSGSLLTGKM